MTGRLVVASANAHKAAELQDLLVSLGIGLDVVARPADLAVPAEDAPDFIGNARIKAAAVAAATGEWALADDSGLEVDELVHEPEGRHARSFPIWQPLLAMDRIYYRGVRPVSCQRLSTGPWRELSDHAALMGVFSLPRRRRGPQ